MPDVPKLIICKYCAHYNFCEFIRHKNSLLKQFIYLHKIDLILIY